MSSQLAAVILKLAGWRTVFTPPPGSKSVVIVYPHTSNWDFPVGVLFRAKHRMTASWAGKDTLFRGPLKALFLWLGGVPINRREHTGMIDQLAEAFATRDSFCICITPEGTRSKSEYWKTGFYRLALAAGVPVGLGFIDYGNKRVGIERWIRLSGNEEDDLAIFREYYADKAGRYPEKSGTIRFRS